jgi:uncharacterized protein involved in propanediol utilization
VLATYGWHEFNAVRHRLNDWRLEFFRVYPSIVISKSDLPNPVGFGSGLSKAAVAAPAAAVLNPTKRRSNLD